MLWQGAQTFVHRLINGQVSSVIIEIPTRDQRRLVRTMRQLMDAILENIDTIAARNAAQVVQLGFVMHERCACVCVGVCVCACACVYLLCMCGVHPCVGVCVRRMGVCAHSFVCVSVHVCVCVRVCV